MHPAIPGHSEKTYVGVSKNLAEESATPEPV
jgi:hypothetical protein